jgi:Holliday junction resolvase RusA-like endonuclease
MTKGRNPVIKFTFLEPPMGKERPRLFVNKNGKQVVFTPNKTRSYERILGKTAEFAMDVNNVKKFPITEPLIIYVKIYHNFPKEDKSFTDFPVITPDIDNVLKIVFDGLNGICYEDDCQICEVVAVRRFSEKPRISVKIESLLEKRRKK